MPDHSPLYELNVPTTKKTFAKQDAQVWVHEGILYVTFHREAKPFIPLPPLPPNRQTPNWIPIRHMVNNLDWIRDGYEYIPFIPTNLVFGDPLFLGLWLDEPHMPMEEDAINVNTTLFRLETTWREHWMDLEALVLRSVNALLRRAGIGDGISLPPKPNCDRLRSKTLTRKKAADSVYAARRRFLPWMGLFSYLVSLLDSIGTFRMPNGQEERWPVWKGTLILAGLSPTTVDSMEVSVLGSFNPAYRRLGTIVNYARDPHALFVGMLADRNVPVVYGVPLSCRLELELPISTRLGEFVSAYQSHINQSGSAVDVRRHLRRFLPPDDYIQRLRVREDAKERGETIVETAGITNSIDFDTHFACQEDGFGPEEVNARSEVTFPQRDPRAGQREFETREQFFERREREDAETINEESDSQRMARMHRERHMEEYEPPGHTNRDVQIFIWERIGSYDIRRKVPTPFASRLWLAFNKSQMRHNACRNEWDVWADTNPTTTTSDVPDEDMLDEGTLGNEDFRNEMDAAGNSDLKLLSLRSLLASVLEPVKRSASTIAGDRLSAQRGLLDTMQWWFGFANWTDGLISDVPEGPLVAHKTVSDANMLKFALHAHTEKLPSGIRWFLSYYIAGHSAPPPVLSDLSGCSITQFGDSRVHVQQSPYSAKLFNDKKAVKRILYSVLLRTSTDWRKRHIFVWTAAAAIAVKRLSSDNDAVSVEHVARNLVGLGVGFILAVPRYSLGTPCQERRVKPLGKRRMNYEPGKSDFVLYQNRCKDLFSNIRLQRVLRCGGILWRIAMDFSDYHYGVDGPSYEAMNEPMHVISESSNDPVLVEDSLSTEEIHLLIGAFESEDASQKHEAVYYSFWPPPWIWESSGYNLGYWTPDAEDWYVNRKEQYEAGTGRRPLRNTEQWRIDLRRSKQTKVIRETYEQHAKKFVVGEVFN